MSQLAALSLCAVQRGYAIVQAMAGSVQESRLTPRLVDSLYTEAMVLADEARSYFDQHGREDRELLPPLQRVAFSCESLKVTTRLMHIVAWLLTYRAVESGEISAIQARRPTRRLGDAADSEPAQVDALPFQARQLIENSRDLYSRVRRLDEEMGRVVAMTSPARGLLDRLEQAF